MPQNQINLLKPRCKSDSFSFRTRISAFISSVIAATMFIVWAVSAANTTIGNNITTSGNLTVGGASSLASLVLSSSFNASSTLQVSATSTFYSFVGIGTTSPGALLAVQGNALVSGNLNVANITATGTLNVTGVTTLTNASTTGMLTIGNGFISTASSTVASSLQVSGSFQASSTATLNQATISNATTTSLAVTGNASTSQLIVSNSATLNTLTGNGLFTLNSGLLSTASSTFSSNLHVSGPLSASSTLLVANLSTLTGGFISQASSTIVGNLSITGALRGSSTATSTMQNGINLVTGCFSINGVCVGGGGSSNWTDAGAYLTPATLSDGIIISASSTVSGNFIVTGGLNASSTLTVAGNSIFYSNVGIGTTSPGALLSVQGNALFSGNLNVANIIGTGTISVTGTSGTSTIGSITFSPRGAIGIGTTTPNLANFEVATRTIAFNSGADGNLGSWATSPNTFAARRFHSSVVANGYVYVLGGVDGSAVQNTAQYAKLNSDGTVGTWWATSTNAFAARNAHSSVTANGYVYVLGGMNGSDATTNTAQYAKLNSDGSVGTWATSTNAFAARYGHTSVTANGYVYVLGGTDSSASLTNTVQYAKLNSDGTVGSWATSPNAFSVREGHSSIAANGYVYVLGGRDGSSAVQNTAQYAKLNSDGTVGSWATSTNTFSVRYFHSSVTANGSVYVLGGMNGSVSVINTVQYAKLNSDGTVGSWATSTNAFAGRYEHSSVTANGYVYVLGGREGSNPTNTAQYASTARILVSGNLDLLGLASTTLGDVNSSDFGSVGGSIFAGNIFSAGQLEVTGNANFWNGVGINGVFSLRASTSLAQDVPIFSIQNATGTSPILTALYNGNVGIGTTSPTSKLSIEGTCIDTGAGCADYAELYTSSEPVEPGDVLVFDQDYAGQVRKAQTGDTALIGAVSTNPAIIIEGSALQLMSGVNYKSNPTKPAVALAGKIPVKVNLEGGDINIGDPITISSIPGIGQKAAESGKIIGYALENLSQASTTAEAKDKIIMFVSLGYWLGPDILNATSTNSSLALSQSNGLLAQVMDTVKAWLESMKIFVEDGLVRLKNLVAEQITAQKAVLDEIELKDEVTRDIYCVRINSGALLTTPGECGSNIDTEPPIITLIGENAIIIEKGISWVDPGATVTDNVNDNLGIYYKVDGVETGNGGRDLPQTAIDTNIIGNHTITYTSTDSAGNIGAATRTVNIVDPVGYSN